MTYLNQSIKNIKDRSCQHLRIELSVNPEVMNGSSASVKASKDEGVKKGDFLRPKRVKKKEKKVASKIPNQRENY